MSRSVAERRAAILEAVRVNGPQKVTELAATMNVSAVTLRRDVEELALRGQLVRRHGTVLPSGPAPTGEWQAATVGLVVPDGSHYYLQIIEGAKQACAEAGARLVLGVSSYDPNTELAQVRRLLTGGVDGLAIAPTPNPDSGKLSPEQENWLGELHVPTVLIERKASSLGPAAKLDSITSPHVAGAGTAVRHLHELGHRHIGALLISGPNSPAIKAGFLHAAAELGMAVEGVLEEGHSNSDDARAAVLQLVRGGVTAMLIHNDYLASRALEWLQDAGLNVPQDVSIVGYDDVFAALSTVPLTAVAPFRFDIGYRAARRLLNRIHGNQGPALPTEHLSVVPKLIIRESTAAMK